MSKVTVDNCPRCGAKANIEKVTHHGFGPTYKAKCTAWPSCFSGHQFDTKVQAAEWWNSRIAKPKLAEALCN